MSIFLIDGRIIPLEQETNEPFAINIALENVLLSASIDSEMNRGIKLPSILTGSHDSICYPIVGCFDNNEPFDNAFRELPQSPEHINTQFLLFTQEAPTFPEFLSFNDNDVSIQKSSLNTSRWLRIIVHGFSNNRSSIWIKPLQDELLKLRDQELSDVIVVDWGNGAKFPLYPNAASNTRLVGKQIGLLLQRLHIVKGLSYDKVHCIGHSLGAHTCGMASNAINNQIARISGLDPAGPLFQGKNRNVRLDENDAKFVDVIHTNTEIALGVGLGSSEASGHVDFYVNGGQEQPGCPSIGTLFEDLLSGHSAAAFEQTSCSHSRSHGYFTESINSQCPYNAFPCHDYNGFVNGDCFVCPKAGCAQMGFHSAYSLGRGNMYLETRDRSPFCGYHYLLELSMDRAMSSTEGEIHVSIHSNYEILANVTLTPKSNTEIKGGDIFRHVFTYNVDMSKVDYAVVYFNKAKNLLSWISGDANNIVISRLRLRSAEDNIVYSGLCQTSGKVATHNSETILLEHVDCKN